MAGKEPSIIDLTAELAKLTTFRGLTPQTKRTERKGSSAFLGHYRDGILFAGKSAGTGHWETHAQDELVHVLDGTRTLDIVCDDGPPRSFELRPAMIVIVPQGAWHRFRSTEDGASWSATMPGPHIELDIPDPRTAVPENVVTGTPSIVDLDAELAKLTMFRGRTPQSTMADRRGSGARLAAYRDGGLFVTKFAGKGHWEAHLPGDELVYIVDGAATLEIVGENGPKSFALRGGMLVVNPQGVWHRFQSPHGVTLMTLTPSPSKVVELDIDDPRTMAHERR